MKQPNRFKIGLLFLLGVLFSVGLLIWQGTSETFGNMRSYAAYFDASVQGLNTGAQVSYKGVRIGRVQSKELAPGGELVRVGLSLEKDFKVADGQVLSLAQQGLAGSAYLKLHAAPAGAQRVEPPFDFDTREPVIPTLSGGSPGMMEMAERLSDKLRSLPLDDLVARWADAGREVETLLKEKDIDRTLDNLRSASSHADDLLQTLSRPAAEEDMQQALADLADTAGILQQAGTDLERRIQALSPDRIENISAGAQSTLQNLQAAVHRLNLLLPQVDKLVRTLRRDPGRVTERREQQEPFAHETDDSD